MSEALPFASMPGPAPAPSSRPVAPVWPFASAALLLAASAAALAGWAPVGFSLATVFLFAGPHNWMEFRVLLTRMPARWGPLAVYFATGLGGMAALAGSFIAMRFLGEAAGWERETWLTASAVWNSALILWLAALIHLRGRQPPARDWSWSWAVAFALIAAVWMWPGWWDVFLVYLHPLVALWFLDRELARSRPAWLGAYRLCLSAVPGLLALLWWRLADAPDLPGTDALTVRLAWHAGAGMLAGVSTHLLVATHAFLEMLHYGVWLLAMPLLAMRSAPWRWDETPLGRRSPGWRQALTCVFTAGAAVVVTLWAGFLADYPATRDVYFTLALAHVLAEAPFLLRML
jgi:hypothetical protein